MFGEIVELATVEVLVLSETGSLVPDLSRKEKYSTNTIDWKESESVIDSFEMVSI